MKKIGVVLVLILVGAGVGYFVGFDHGFEKSVRETKQFIAACETKAENVARQELKQDAGDDLRIEQVLSSSQYRDQYSLCLASRGL